MNYLLDTNVLSELVRPKPDRHVTTWVASVPENQLYLSALTIGEIRKGIDMHGDGKRKRQLTQWLEHDLCERFENRIITVDVPVAERWGQLLAQVRSLPAVDSLIGASCLVHQLVLVTRNVKDFERIDGLALLNPWRPA